jgi:hypothetical protein
MNTKFATLAVLGTLSLIAAAPRAQAADNGFYLGAGLTRSEFDTSDFGSDTLDDNSYKVIAGIRPLDWLAFEANYIDLGKASSDFVGTTTKLEATAVTASVLGLYEVGLVDFYARAGLAHWKFDASVGNESDSDTGDEFTYGVGVGVHFGSIGVRAEYEKFNVDRFNTDINTASISFTYTFL